MDARTAFKKGIGQLRDAGVSSFTLAAELLLLHVAAKDRTWLYAHPEDELLPEQEQRFFALVTRRIDGEPTQYLTGKQEFWSLEFEVTPAVLIPRPETEHVIEVALDRLALREIRAGRKQTLSGEGLRIADIGTGSGCIAVALAKDLPGTQFVATDISPAALEVAMRNAQHHGFADRIDFIESNLLDQLANHARRFVAALPPDRQQSALHRPPRSANAGSRSARPRTRNCTLRRRRRLRTLRRPNRTIRRTPRTRRHPRSRIRPQQPPRRPTPLRHAAMDPRRRRQRPRWHPPRHRRRKNLIVG